jgi:hypothetical protein
MAGGTLRLRSGQAAGATAAATKKDGEQALPVST